MKSDNRMLDEILFEAIVKINKELGLSYDPFDCIFYQPAKIYREYE